MSNEKIKDARVTLGQLFKARREEMGHGGQRSGSGRPRQFEEPTTINFKCELSDKLAAKEKHGKLLNKLFIEWLKSLQPDSAA